jgi:hypothetical protein
MEACHMRRRIHACMYDSYMEACFVYGGMPYEEEDTCMYVRLESYMEACHMRRRIHACMYDSYMEAYHMRRRIHACMYDSSRIWRHTI